MSQFLSRKSEVALGVAFLSFMTFAVVEMLYAFISNSLALLGDSAAMLVDACTYLCNYLAIRYTKDAGSSHLTIAGPFVSAVALTGVMIYVLIDAIGELLSSGGDGVKLQIVLIFGCANLLLDFLNLVLFYAFPEAYRAILTFTDPEALEADGGLNIRSALTHVLADTYRSLAVIASAVTSMLNHSISSSKSDAVAAIAVELPILVMCFQMVHAVSKRFLQPPPKPPLQSTLLSETGEPSAAPPSAETGQALA
mmetsp:Transcript_18662/g.58688  ORF Transcript_18662/g.58688 Transcript_18662/m.58688 type:complete len:253 (+) Transcript_18662:94-852(+)|eukprot:CAMPEP_0197396390 /NCGR_PEP_ID=MMETSP1165-20131217/9470_1 /TAXON_ID=284809 /ORGANISM="Chrysocystis fragilis, Strain CCMP3189" /LENGTH=252 /DNA_ID=CAMNT_0042922215 /DNA_START=82 /DNA_END=840 /DNA_ORIENTATION=-